MFDWKASPSSTVCAYILYGRLDFPSAAAAHHQQRRRPAISRLVNSELSDLRRSRPSLMSGTIYSIQVGVNPVQIHTYIYTARLSWLVGHHAARSVCAQSNLDSSSLARARMETRRLTLLMVFTRAYSARLPFSSVGKRKNKRGWMVYIHTP